MGMLENQVEKLVIVLIPRYNAEEFIERAFLLTYENDICHGLQFRLKKCAV